MKIKRILGIYNADGGLWGEMRYITGRIFGKSHCALCDITHGVAGNSDTLNDGMRVEAQNVTIMTGTWLRLV